MKIKPGYILREVMNVFVVLGIGSETYMPNQIMSLNETGAFLWNSLKSETTEEVLVEQMIREYEVDKETAAKDVDAFLSQLRENGLIEE